MEKFEDDLTQEEIDNAVGSDEHGASGDEIAQDDLARGMGELMDATPEAFIVDDETLLQ